MRELADAGIKAGVGIAPVLPGISDRPDQLAEVVRAARAAGATGIWANLLYLKPGTREHFLAQLGRDWPEQVERYEQLYGQRAYLTAAETKPVKELVARLGRESGAGTRRPVLRPPPQPEQLSLSLA